MEPDLHTRLERGEVSSSEKNEECGCARVHYGMVIMMVLIGFAGGVLTGIYLSVPLTVAACQNITGVRP